MFAADHFGGGCSCGAPVAVVSVVRVVWVLELLLIMIATGDCSPDPWSCSPACLGISFLGCGAHFTFAFC